jgi:hypothetical protein
MKKISKEKELEAYAIRRLSNSPLRVNPQQTLLKTVEAVKPPEVPSWHS